MMQDVMHKIQEDKPLEGGEKVSYISCILTVSNQTIAS